ncbi:uncharacterized protein [Scyliorhinus torazame]|uniref:uncharacterized protein n=1 Tax=Scyliorhinus torazame TaxID=75743 RepID=UPI003B5B3C24
MGFEERQVQAALQAGLFNVQDATEWLLQGGDHTKRGQGLRVSRAGAMSAFNPPFAHGPAPSLPHAIDSQRHSSAETGSPPQAATCPVLPLSRRNLDLKEFEEQQRGQVAQQIKAERRKKLKDHELVLMRIADDRENLKAKLTPACQPDPPPQGQKLGGKVQTAVGNHCLLMIRLPSGECLRERFRQEDTLQCVKDYVAQQCPKLQVIALLQGFPKRHFSDTDLGSTLEVLGLSPNATLCVRDEEQRAKPQQSLPPGAYTLTAPSVPGTGIPADGDRLVRPSTPPEHHLGSRSPAQRSWGRGEALGYRPTGEVAAHKMEERRTTPGRVQQPEFRTAGLPELRNAGIPELRNAGIPALMEYPSRSSHFWGRGQKLVAAEQGELPNSSEGQPDRNVGEVVNLIPEDQLIPPAFDPEVIFRQNGNRIRSGFEPRYQWPNQGNRLREAREEAANQDGPRQQDLPTVAAQAAMERLNRAAESQAGHITPSSQKKPCRATLVPSLFKMATGGAVALMTAPSMQYSRSLACLTPELAEHLLRHMIHERLLRPKSLELFFGCQIQKLVLNCYPYATNELLRQLRAFQSLKHLSLTSCSLITDSGLELVSSLQRLQQLNLAACVKLTDHCLCSLNGESPILAHTEGICRLPGEVLQLRVRLAVSHQLGTVKDCGEAVGGGVSEGAEWVIRL